MQDEDIMRHTHTRKFSHGFGILMRKPVVLFPRCLHPADLPSRATESKTARVHSSVVSQWRRSTAWFWEGADTPPARMSAIEPVAGRVLASPSSAFDPYTAALDHGVTRTAPLPPRAATDQQVPFAQSLCLTPECTACLARHVVGRWVGAM